MDSPPTGPVLGKAPRTAGQAARTVARRVRLRRRLALGRSRIRTSWWGVAQSAVGAALAWDLSVRLLHHPAPFFASVAAIVCLSTSYLNRLRRVIEMGIGVAVGVGLGDVLVRVIGHGALQLALTVLIAMTAALLLDGGALIVNQAALQAVFVVALPPPSGGYVGRWEDALMGGAVALAIAFAAPADPRPELRGDVDHVIHIVAVALRAAATAAREGDPEAAYQALELARTSEAVLTAWRSSVQAGQDITRLSPLRRSGAREVAAHERAIEPMDHAVRNLRVALRRLVVVVEEGSLRSEPAEQTLIDALEQLAGALFTIPGALRDPDGEGGRRALTTLTRVAVSLDPGPFDGHGLSASVVVAQLRSAVVDLFAIVGVDAQVVRGLLP
ncbi:MAG: FUSC family protein [Kineosporiaceae bacterium]